MHPRQGRGTPPPVGERRDQHSVGSGGAASVEYWRRLHPDDPVGNHLHLTDYPANMDDRSHLALFLGLPGLRGAQVQRSELKREFAHARRNAYLYFGTPQQAAQTASIIRNPGALGGASTKMAFPLLRVQQTRADDLIRLDYVRPNHHACPDEGLPPSRVAPRTYVDNPRGPTGPRSPRRRAHSRGRQLSGRG